ncbi:hypothetical protein BDY19DRAFT_1053936 [Irpex rosettiformis]|uniref:Uncharacterized protein n=1 Tax=Irpex rosettiformis TaxID=378272 RepID=A0ACB8UDW6_9APHY|nr:hypothetical protein BDY19DRAFT_1053936 [Irpex rosettiformis]
MPLELPSFLRRGKARSRSPRPTDDLATNSQGELHSPTYSCSDPPPPYESRDSKDSKKIRDGPDDEEVKVVDKNLKQLDDLDAPAKLLGCQNLRMQAGPSGSVKTQLFTEEEEAELAYYLPILAQYDTIILLDDSFSMRSRCGFRREADGRYPSRWDVVKELIGDLAGNLAKYDTDGIDVHFLNNIQASASHLKSREAVEALFNPPPPNSAVEPTGPTFIGRRLRGLFQSYEKSTLTVKHPSKPKKANYIIFTDGEPSDKYDLEQAITAHAKWLSAKNYPKDQVGIQFFQIGDDREATQYLQKLDDTLKTQDMRDIVDTTRYVGSKLTVHRIVKVCLGGFDKRLDEVQLTAQQ